MFCLPVCDSCHFSLIPAEQISVKFLSIIRKVERECHVLEFLIDLANLAAYLFSICVDVP
jgi:hypothetical protein